MSAETARLLLGKLLNRIEGTPLDERARPVAQRVPNTVQSGEARRVMETVLAAAAHAGAIVLVHGRGETGHLVTGIRLRDAGLLYRHLCRSPAPEVAAKVANSLRQELAPLIGGGALGALAELEQGWQRARQPYGLAPEHDEARRFLIALDAVLRRPATDRSDLRTFSAKAGLDSKLIERQAWRIAKWMITMGRLPPGLTDEEARSALGLQKFAHPVLVAGQAVLRGLDVGRLGYVGVAPGDIEALRPGPQAEVVLTVENFASFNRHVSEAMTGREVVVYSGGFPSQATVRALRRLCAVPGRQVLHWGDIDGGGLRIADHLAREVAPGLGLHLMTEGLARAHGQPVLADVSLGTLGATAEIAALAEFLAGPGARSLEQERLDPVAIHPGTSPLQPTAASTPAARPFGEKAR